MGPLYLNDSCPGTAASGEIRTGDIISIKDLEGKDLLKANSGFITYIFIRYGTLEVHDEQFIQTKCVIGCINTKVEEKAIGRLTYFEIDTDKITIEQKIGVNRYVFFISSRNERAISLIRVEEYNFLSRYETSNPDQYTYYELTDSFTQGSSYCMDGKSFREIALQHPNSFENGSDMLGALDDCLYSIQLGNVRKMNALKASINLTESSQDLLQKRQEVLNLCEFNRFITEIKTIVCLKPNNTNFLNKNKRALHKKILGKEPP